MTYLCILLLLLWTGIADAAGTVRYVDAVAGACTGNYSIANRTCTGSDGNSYATINAAAAAMASGDLTYVRVGTYVETLLNALPSGTASFRTTLSSYNGELVTVRPGVTSSKAYESAGRSYITLYGITWDGINATSDVIKLTTGSNNFIIEGPPPVAGVYLCRAINGFNNGISAQGVMDTLTIRNCEITGNALRDFVEPISHGMYIQKASNFLMEGNAVHGNACLGISAYPDLVGAVIRRNLFYDNGVQVGCGTQVMLSNDNQIFEYNLVWNDTQTNNTQGVRVQYTSPNGSILRHNTVYNGGSLGCFYVASDAVNITLQNNLAIGCTIGINNLGTGTTLTDNVTSGTASAIFKSITTGAFDLSLKVGTSLALDAGTDIGLPANGLPDHGATEVPKFSSCEVKAGEPTRVYFRFTNNLRPPMLPASGVTGVTFRRNTVANAPTSFTRTTDNEYYAVVTTSQSAGEAIDMSIAPASTNLTDSSFMGGRINQSFISTITNQSCTNNLGGAPTHTFTQARYELHDWRGLETSPIILPHGSASTGAAENFASYKVPPGAKLRIRYAIVCGVADCPTVAFHPYVSTGAAYTIITDNFSSNNIKMCGMPSGDDMPTNGAATTNQLSTSGTFVPGGVVFTANDIPEVTGLNVGFKTEMEYCLEIDTDATGFFDIRVYLDSGEDFVASGGAYTVTPRLVSEPAAAGVM